VWQDFRTYDATHDDIYAQRVDAAGAPQWSAGGVALCTAADNQYYPTIASDGAGGAIATWWDNRSATGYFDIYAQRVNAAGVPQWTSDGLALCTAPNNQIIPTIVSDGAGGAIVTWQDDRGAAGYIYAQRVNAAGVPQWTADGVALSTATAAGKGSSPVIASDGAGGAIVAWLSGPGGPGSYYIYAQRVDAAGAPQWTVDGVLCAGQSCNPPTIASDGAGGAIVTWQDNRSGADIYAQRVYGSGGVAAVSPPGAPARFQLLAPSPNPSRDGQLTIRFNLPSTERVSAQVLDVQGHRVRTLATDREFPPGTQVLGWDGRNNAGVSLPNGVYFVEVRAGTHAEARRAILLH